MVLAMRSLPVPLSPWIRMVVASLEATFCTKFISSVIFGETRDHFVIAGAPAHFAAQRLDLGAQPRGFERVLDGDVQFVEIERLADEVVGAQLERGLDVIELGIGGDHDDGAERRRLS